MSVWRRPPAGDYLDRLAENIGQGLDVAAAVRESSRRNVLLNLEWICLQGPTVRVGLIEPLGGGKTWFRLSTAPTQNPTPTRSSAGGTSAASTVASPASSISSMTRRHPNAVACGRVCQRAESAMRPLVWFRTSVMDW